MFENVVVRRIFGPKRDEITGGWVKLRNEELHNLYSSPDIIRMSNTIIDFLGIIHRTERWITNKKSKVYLELASQGG
jgi:hypothetical protein